MPRLFSRSAVLFWLVASIGRSPCRADDLARTVRFATFNTSLNRSEAGRLIADLKWGDDQQARKVAAIIQRIHPDVLLLNEFDYDPRGDALRLFLEHYLGVGQYDQPAIRYPYHFTAPVNTGVPSGRDLDHDGRVGGPGDAFGFGRFPGQYGMVVLSRFPIERARVRTFRRFLWKQMRGAELPVQPATGQSFYSADDLDVFRLSSKSLWDVPIQIAAAAVHFIVSHPTPPIFDGPEDRNGCRNHDEIRLLADYIDPRRAVDLVDDRGRRGGLPEGARFVIAGDMNADPVDGSNRDHAIGQLLNHPRVHGDCRPVSAGGVEQSRRQGKANRRQRGDPALDTADFPDRRPGNLRVDYVLPSKNLDIASAGVFWPQSDDPAYRLVDASDHRLVWVDLRFPRKH